MGSSTEEEFSFNGFPPQALQFLRDLARNNNRPWFQAHKPEYENRVLLPAAAFVVALGRRLKGSNEGIHYDPRTNGRGSVMRIYRDIRFSKDKSPYKTYIGVRFWQGAKGGSSPTPGYFIHLVPEGAEVYAGIHAFHKSFLNDYRAAVDRESSGARLQSIVDRLRDSRYEVGGESLKRIPPEYDPEHRRGRLLRFKSLYAKGARIAPNVVTSPDMVEGCYSQCAAMAPLNDWLTSVGA